MVLLFIVECIVILQSTYRPGGALALIPSGVEIPVRSLLYVLECVCTRSSLHSCTTLDHIETTAWGGFKNSPVKFILLNLLRHANTSFSSRIKWVRNSIWHSTLWQLMKFIYHSGKDFPSPIKNLKINIL